MSKRLRRKRRRLFQQSTAPKPIPKQSRMYTKTAEGWNVTKASATPVKARRKNQRDMNFEAFIKERLPYHLQSTPLGRKFSELVHKLPDGVKMSVKQLLDQEFPKFKINPEQGDFTSLESTATFAEDNRIGVNMGVVYKRAIKLTHGAKSDEQMKTAKKLYKPQNFPCFDSQSAKYYGSAPYGQSVLKNLLSYTGANRQGVWYPFNIGLGGGGSTWTSPVYMSHMAGYISPMLLRAQYYYEIREELINSDLKDWLSEEENLSADLFFAINSVTDTVTFANGMQYLPLDLKIYICRCKSRTKYAPAQCWYIPSFGIGQEYNTMRSDYVYRTSPTDLKDPETGNKLTSWLAEPSVHIESTPFYSSTFRNHWEVIDVVKQSITPTDKFELTLHREFRHAHSLRNMEQEYDTMTEEGWYCEGDYALIITFSGQPCFLKYTGPATDGNADMKEVNNSPAKLLMTSRSKMSITCPELYDSSNTTRSTTNNYISGEGRILDTQLNTLAFNNTDWKINVMTNLSEETGGER